ncbi:Os02g0590550 [Oryza sativa Japonica Group]|uniref:Os02g0590550 protein n=1 Tax=Oryza sativa subsp. japonica TaxID=39947 RepID=A0A0P0VL81_ORYSJ|nr:Os02g0590550 [Oryza sativa Japonica Group]
MRSREAFAALVLHPRLMLPRWLAAAADVVEWREPHWLDLAINEELASTAAPSPPGKRASWARLDSALTNGLELCMRYRIRRAAAHSDLTAVPSTGGCARPLRRRPL